MRLYDPLYGKIIIDPEFESLVNSPWFRRLQHLRQLGLCYLSFPGGNHTRFEHSLGAFYLATIVGQSDQVTRFPEFDRAIDKQRLVKAVQLGALLHDIGHGPFSHMTENVLLGLGGTITHEELGSAIITHFLKSEFKPFIEEWGIKPRAIAGMLTKVPTDDSIIECCTPLITSDFDLDRLDYLHRDLHYSGVEGRVFRPDLLLSDFWKLSRKGRSLQFEVLRDAIPFVEQLLFMRRSNYQRIVYESRHMAATGMYEKAVFAASRSSSQCSTLIAQAVEQKMDWTDEVSVGKGFAVLWQLFGLVDYEAGQLIESSSQVARYLMTRIRRGQFFDSSFRSPWTKLHYRAQASIAGLKSSKAAFKLRRALEDHLAIRCGIDPVHIVAHLPRVPSRNLLLLGTEFGTPFEEQSDLGRFLRDDGLTQYALEVFCDSSISSDVRTRLAELATQIFQDGILPEEISHAH